MPRDRCPTSRRVLRGMRGCSERVPGLHSGDRGADRQCELRAGTKSRVRWDGLPDIDGIATARRLAGEFFKKCKCPLALEPVCFVMRGAS